MLNKLMWLVYIANAIIPSIVVWNYTHSAVSTLWTVNAAVWGLVLGQRIATKVLTSGTR